MKKVILALFLLTLGVNVYAGYQGTVTADGFNDPSGREHNVNGDGFESM